jgi:hypothetical protein
MNQAASQPYRISRSITEWLTPSPSDSRMAQRVTLRKRQPYNTTSNRRRVVKTPGGKLVYHHLKKLPTQPKCGDCGIGLPGVSTMPYPASVNEAGGGTDADVSYGL